MKFVTYFVSSQESRFSKCDVCAAIKEARERTLNSTVRGWLTEILDKHIQLEKYVMLHVKILNFMLSLLCVL